MQSCLGIYIENNLIKYAKVSRDRDNIKIESFGTKFYEDLPQTIKQVVQETNSAKTPISVNLDGEYYDYFDFFALLNKNDLKKSIEIEFEMLCREKNIRKDDMEKRYIFVVDSDKENRMKAINVSIEKQKVEQRKELFEDYNLSAIKPLPIGITNIAKTEDVECELIVNLEEKTTLTFIQNGQIDLIQEIDSSISEALREISKRENSDSKAYEILKNTTITSQDLDIQEGNEYLDVVIPVLFKILTEIKEKMAEYGKQINKVYFTGTGIVINNVDMYFQDRMNDIECDIIKPSFLEAQSLKVGIKDYIEVNSAISLALQGMGTGATNDLNFAGKNAISKIGIEMPNLPGGKKVPELKSLKETSGEPLDAYERTIMRILMICLVFILGYTIIGNKLYTDMDTKKDEAIKKQEDTSTSITNMGKTKLSIEGLNSEYQSVIAKLNNQSLENGEVIFENWEVANFLTQIASVIPTEVKLISIENTTGRHFVIQARSIKYQQLGYFKALLEANEYLENVTASTGIRQSSTIESTLSPDVGTTEEYIVVTIEGDLK